jgi:hypothetical protein
MAKIYPRLSAMDLETAGRPADSGNPKPSKRRFSGDFRSNIASSLFRQHQLGRAFGLDRHAFGFDPIVHLRQLGEDATDPPRQKKENQDSINGRYFNFSPSPDISSPVKFAIFSPGIIIDKSFELIKFAQALPKNGKRLLFNWRLHAAIHKLPSPEEATQ